MATIDEISIRIDANVNTALQNLRKVQREADKTQRALKGLDDDVEIDIKADAKSALNDVKALQKTLKDLKASGAVLDFDSDAIEASLRKIRADLRKFERSDGSLDIRANINDALAQIRTLENAINRVEGNEIDITANTRAAQTALDRLGQNLDAELRVDTTAARTNFGDFLTNVRARFGDAFRGGGGLGDIFNITGGGGGGLLDFTANVQALSQAREAAQQAAEAQRLANRQARLPAARQSAINEYTRRFRENLLSEADLADSEKAIQRFANEILDAGDAAVTAGSATGLFSRGLAAIGGTAGAAALGVGSVVVAAGAFAVAAGNAYNQVQLTDSGLKAISKTTIDYATASAFAKEAQSLLGGTLSENIEIIRQLQLASNLTGASLKELLDTALLLSVTNPGEGLEGAAFALRELLTGDYASLVERFNLPRQAVQDIRDALFPESGPGITSAEALQRVNELLATQGVTLETVTARTETNAAATERLAAAWERLLVALGAGPGGFIADTADVIANAINAIANAIQFPELGATVTAFEDTSSFEEYIARYQELAELQRQVAMSGGSPIAISVPAELTAAEYEYIQLLKERGLTTEQAYREFALLSAEQRSNIEAETQAIREQQNATEEAQIAESERRREQFQNYLNLQGVLQATGELGAQQAERRLALEDKLARASQLEGAAKEAALLGISRQFDITIAQAQQLLDLYNRLNASPFGFSVPGFVQIKPNAAAPTAIKPPRPPAIVTGGGGKSAAEKEAEDLERLRQRILEAERRYRKELLKIEADYYKRSNAARVVFSDQQFSSRAGFYDRLAQFEDQGLRKTLSAQYEQAQIEAGKISDQFGGDVAERFLQASEDAILARAQRALGIQQAEAEGRFGDAEYLRGVDRLYRIEEDRRIERSKNTEDSIEQDRSDALKEAQDNYKDTLEGFILGEEQKLAAVKLVNDALREQGLLGSTSITGEGGAVSLNIQSTQLDDIKKSIDALALRLPVGV